MRIVWLINVDITMNIQILFINIPGAPLGQETTDSKVTAMTAIHKSVILLILSGI